MVSGSYEQMSTYSMHVYFQNKRLEQKTNPKIIWYFDIIFKEIGILEQETNRFYFFFS
jgi:hypothetical protein